jgi:hypothetical protein
MTTKAKVPDYYLRFDVPSNGRLGPAMILVIDRQTDKTLCFDKADISSGPEREKAVKRLADKLGLKSKLIDKLRAEVDVLCNKLMDQRLQQQERESAEAAMPPPQLEEIPESERLLKETPEHVLLAAKAMLHERILIDLIQEDIAVLGVAGERNLTASIYLVYTSRKLPRPLSVIVQGASASGKSYPIERVAEMMPPEDVILATQMTPQALFHMRSGSLKNKLVVGGERSRLEDDDRAEATRALREMISSGRLSKLMPMKVEGGLIETVCIEQDGPIAFVESTTLSKIFDEDANRCVVLQTDERDEQTKLVYKAVAARYGGGFDPQEIEAIIQKHRAIQRLLKPAEVVIPFAAKLVELLPSDRVEGRRAVGHILGAIAACAFLYQFQRGRDGAGRVVAAEEDYTIVRTILGRPMGKVFGNRVSDAAARYQARLKTNFNVDQFTSTTAAKGECVSDRAARGWLHELHDAGLLELVEDGRGRKPSVWRIPNDAPDAEDNSNLPAVEAVFLESHFRQSDNEKAFEGQDVMSEP